jgi:hypothetical protein
MRTSRRGPGIAAVALLLSIPARAGFTPSDIGTSGAQFLKLGAGARAEGMGEAYTSVADDADAMYWNPAALTRIQKHDAALMEAPLLAGINYQYAGYGQKVGASTALGAIVQYVSQPAISETDTSGFATGSAFHPSDLAAGIGGAYKFKSEDLGILNGASLGIVGKYVESTITRSAATYAVDLGYLSGPIRLLGGDMRISYVVRNLGGELRFQQVSDPLPVNLMLGAAWEPNEDWTLAMNINEPLDNTVYLSLGSEYRYHLNDDTTFAGRIGIITRDIGGIGGFNGLNVGLGGKFHHVGIDYAFVPMGSLGLTNYISVNFSF